MKKPIISHVIDKFIDYKGDERQFIVATVSTPVNDVVVHQQEEVFDMAKKISFGYAICHNKDDFNSELGLRIAVNRAERIDNTNFIVVSKSGMINEDIIKLMLWRQANFIKQNPGAIIRGYEDEKKAYIASQEKETKLAAIAANLNDEDKRNLEYLRNVSDETRNNILALLNA